MCDYALHELWLLTELIMFSDANKGHHNRTRIWCSSMLEQASLPLITLYPLILITVPFPLPNCPFLSLHNPFLQHRLSFY